MDQITTNGYSILEFVIKEPNRQDAEGRKQPGDEKIWIWNTKTTYRKQNNRPRIPTK